VLLSLEGLHPPSMGARISFAGGKPKVTDGPFAEAKEVLRRLLDDSRVKSREERSSGPSAAPLRRTRRSRSARCRRCRISARDPSSELGAREQGLRDELERKSKKR